MYSSGMTFWTIVYFHFSSIMYKFETISISVKVQKHQTTSEQKDAGYVWHCQIRVLSGICFLHKKSELIWILAIGLYIKTNITSFVDETTSHLQLLPSHIQALHQWCVCLIPQLLLALWWLPNRHINFGSLRMLHKDGTSTGASSWHECTPIFVLQIFVISVLFYAFVFKIRKLMFQAFYVSWRCVVRCLLSTKFGILEMVRMFLSFVIFTIFASLL